MHAKGLVHLLQRRVPGHAPSAIGQREDVARFSLAVELVLDFAHDLLQHVFNRDQPRHAAKLVHHDGHVIAVDAKSAQQIVQPLALGHEHGRAHQRAHAQLGRALQFEQVLGHQDAGDVLALALIDGKARMRRVNHRAQQRFVRRVNVEHVHARRGHHHLLGRHLRQAQHAFEHHAAVGVNQLLVLGLGQRVNQLMRRIHARVQKFNEPAEKTPLVFRTP